MYLCRSTYHVPAPITRMVESSLNGEAIISLYLLVIVFVVYVMVIAWSVVIENYSKEQNKGKRTADLYSIRIYTEAPTRAPVLRSGYHSQLSYNKVTT